MPARTGAQYLAELSRDRNIWLGHEKVDNVAEHPEFAGAARSMAGLFDLQFKHPEDCLIKDPETGEDINASHMIPRSKQDVLDRHRIFERFAEYSVGQMGRSADYMNATYAGFAGCIHEWMGDDNDRWAENMVAYQKLIARQDLLLTHTIVGPTVDRATDGLKPANIYDLRKVGETEHGIIVRGAKVLATLAPYADEIGVYPAGPPLPPEATDFAIAFAIPMNTPGLKFLCRDSTAKDTNSFDHPFSSRFDEQDAFVIFDDVEVPWDRVHLNGSTKVFNAVARGSRRPNVMQQTMVRAQTKFEFAWGLATRMVEAINGMQPPTPQMLGEIWTFSEFSRSAVATAEEAAYDHGGGVWFADGSPLYALAAAVPAWMPRVNEIIRLLGSHNMFAAPTRQQLGSELAPLIERYLPGAGSVSAEKRARIFRMAWDFSGTALALRNEQYERFYLTSSARNYQAAHFIGKRARADRLVDQFLD